MLTFLAQIKFWSTVFDCFSMPPRRRASAAATGANATVPQMAAPVFIPVVLNASNLANVQDTVIIAQQVFRAASMIPLQEWSAFITANPSSAKAALGTAEKVRDLCHDLCFGETNKDTGLARF